MQCMQYMSYIRYMQHLQHMQYMQYMQYMQCMQYMRYMQYMQDMSGRPHAHTLLSAVPIKGWRNVRSTTECSSSHSKCSSGHSNNFSGHNSLSSSAAKHITHSCRRTSTLPCGPAPRQTPGRRLLLPAHHRFRRGFRDDGLCCPFFLEARVTTSPFSGIFDQLLRELSVHLLLLAAPARREAPLPLGSALLSPSRLALHIVVLALQVLLLALHMLLPALHPATPTSGLPLGHGGICSGSLGHPPTPK